VRLQRRELVERRATGPDLSPGLVLTEPGERIREILVANWEGIEEALLGELDRRQRKRLRRILGRFAELLRL
ncbi:MAG TPA: hypothetical protein GYA10_04955, partial [Alphaproteobacteria bacterium]|nr:hypothetical protein [Alphaproteobacteria bacterium]